MRNLQLEEEVALESQLKLCGKVENNMYFQSILFSIGVPNERVGNVKQQ